MDSSSNFTARVDRELASLKILSRLIGHELHGQAGQRITLSRDEVQEIQMALDNFIAVVARNRPKGSNGVQSADTAPVTTRMMN